MLKIALPTLRKRLDPDSSAQPFFIASFESIKTNDVGHANFLLVPSDEFDCVASTHHPLAGHGKIETGAAARQKPFDDIGSHELDAQFVAGHSWFGDDGFRLTDSKSVPDVDRFLE